MTYGPRGAQEEVQGYLNRLAGTTQLDSAGAANLLAGTTNLELVGALNRLAGVTGYAYEAALAAISTAGGSFLLMETGDGLLDESSNHLILE